MALPFEENTMGVCHLCHTTPSADCAQQPRRQKRTLLLLAIIASLMLTVACATSRPKPAQDDYTGQARYAYDKGFDSYESGEYTEALKTFNFVRTKYPYSEFAALASLRIADTYFAQDQYPNAIEAYRRFIQIHPTHQDVPYAYYRVSVSYYEQLPSDWFLVPPAYEKDLASTEEAMGALKRFLELYPNSQFSEEIAEKLATVRQRLADHEFYVATFYLQREKPRAAAMRLEYLLEAYPGAGFDQEALFLLGKAYVLIKDVPRAVASWNKLIEQYPDHPLARQAVNYIQRFGLDNASVDDAKENVPSNKSPEPTLPDVNDESFKLQKPLLGE